MITLIIYHVYYNYNFQKILNNNQIDLIISYLIDDLIQVFIFLIYSGILELKLKNV